MEEGGWRPHDRGQVNERNRALVRSLPSIVSDKSPCDPCHWPENRAHLASDGLLEMIPLTREEHEKLDTGDPWTTAFVEANAPDYFIRIYRSYRNTNHYLGPPARVAEVRLQAEEQDRRRARAMGVTA